MGEEVELKFTAPPKPGHYTFTVNVKSDSYLGVDVTQDIKLDVHEARDIPDSHVQWSLRMKMKTKTARLRKVMTNSPPMTISMTMTINLSFPKGCPQLNYFKNNCFVKNFFRDE